MGQANDDYTLTYLIAFFLLALPVALALAVSIGSWLSDRARNKRGW